MFIQQIVIMLFHNILSKSIVSKSNLQLKYKFTRMLQYSIKYAKIEDISDIKLCNLITLPENYSYDYFRNHILRYPNYSFIIINENNKLLGYCLGKLENENEIVKGHFVSLAIYSEYRRFGLANELINKLHKEYILNNIASVSLKVRVSNIGAIKLYEKYGYKCEKLLSNYYEDNEDAWQMIVNDLK